MAPLVQCNCNRRSGTSLPPDLTMDDDADSSPSDLGALGDFRSTRESEIQGIVDRLSVGITSGPVAAMELLLVTHDLELAEQVLSGVSATPDTLAELRSLLSTHAKGCSEIASMLRSGVDSWAAAPTVESGIEATRALFDASVATSEESSVALYSLGSPALLAEATAEAVDVLDRWAVFDAGREALEIGCGIGRLLPPLSARLRAVVGTDISKGMIEAARRRTEALPNVRVLVSSGRDLSPATDASFDLVLAVDVFPYVARSGPDLVRRMFRETSRVLDRKSVV